METWNLELPPVFIEGSDRAWVTAVGDLLALSLEVKYYDTCQNVSEFIV